MAMKFATSIIFASSVGLLSTADARALRNQEGASGVMNADDLKKTLLEEIEKNFAAVGKRGRLARLEAALKPLFDSLPKNEHGNLGHSPVRYALHRIFVQRHGWYIKGLEPDGDNWNTTSPAGVLKDKVSSYVEELFEARLGGRGFNLHDTAVLAATLEHLIHDESQSRLSKAYDLKKISANTEITRAQADSVLDEYMKYHLLSDDMASKVSEKDMKEIFPGWAETQQFVRDIRSEIERTSTTSGKMSFAAMTHVVEEVGERFGHFQNAECSAMKTKLVGMGDGGIGRVPLANFYQTSIDGDTFEFQESESYLRELGALDDTDPSHPSVIIPNYIQSATNCIASESLYSVCCLNECEQLMSHLEQDIDAPDAEPSRIAAIVASLSSSTVEAPRNLSPTLLQKLDDAAATHGGTVQLHGRLFGQWMHHAFPRECPFPHVAGSTNPQTPDEWMSVKGQESFATKAEMRKYAPVAKPKDEVRELNLWHAEEELLVPFPSNSNSKGRSGLWFIFSVVMLSAALISVASRAAAPVKAAKAALESLSHPDEITKIKADMAWEEPVRESSMMRLRSRGDRSYLPA